MKTVAISDLHGLDPREIYDKVIFTFERLNEHGELHRIDNIVFLGDFMDNRAIDPDLQIKRLMDLFDIQDNDTRVKLLLGNHDCKYLDYYEGEYKDKMSTKDQIEQTISLYQDNLKRFDIAFFDGTYLFSHTGITREFIKAIDFKCEANSATEVCNLLNKMLQCKMYKELFYSVDGLKYRHCVKNNNPEYNQFRNLLKDKMYNNQVVGHYASEGIQIKNGIYMIEDFNHGNIVLFES